MEHFSVKTFRNIEARCKILGLEMQDWATVLAVAGILLALSGNLSLNMICVAALWAWIAFVKAKQAPGYTRILLEHLSSPKDLKVEMEIKND
ncbi:hypothetical protein ACFL6Y_05695 [Elusimicrobiota bacterium]